MALVEDDLALTEALGPTEGAALLIKQVALVALGIIALVVAAKIKVPMFPSPVPITLGTFAVLTIGATYGPRLGLTTILGYMIIGALGFDIFASSSAENNGIAYMLGGSGGYLLGYVLAVGYLGWAAWEQTMAWGLTPYIIGDLMKLALAALLVPALWKLVGDART